MEVITRHETIDHYFQPPHMHWPRSDGRTDAGSRAATAGVSSSCSVSLSIVTAEGDTVTVSAASSSASTYAYAAVSPDEGGEVGAQLRSSVESSSSSVVMAVSGELNKEETRDIAKAIKSYELAAKNLLGGRTGAAQAHVDQIGRLDAIASFQADYSFEKTVFNGVNGVGPS